MSRPFVNALLILIFLLVAHRSDAADRRVQLTFYAQSLEVEVPEGFRYLHELRIDEMGLRGLFREFERRPYRSLLTELQVKATDWQLNDWLLACLIRQTMQAVYGTSANAAVVEYSTYFLLAKCGYDVRLTYRDRRLQVNVFTQDVLYEVPMISDGGRRYANISVKSSQEATGRAMYLLGQAPMPNGRAFSFVMEQWPRFTTERATREVVFQYGGLSREVQIDYDAGLAVLMKDYPLVDEQWYVQAPLSRTLEISLIPQLKRAITGLSEYEALELLVAFTRSAFVYQDDKSAFGYNKPMVADELFYYPFSDCEDRVALFYSLVKTLLDLPMIVIAYDDHLSLAVAVSGGTGDAVNYRGRKYLFCDPTGPRQSSKIGVVPQGYEQRSFEVIGHYPGTVPDGR